MQRLLKKAYFRLDILPTLKDGDSHNWRAMPGTGAKFIQDVFSSIHISVMHTSTLRTNPVPYSKTCDTFRPRIGQSAAIRTGLGCITLVDLFKPCAMPNGLVREFVSKSRPSSIKHRLGHGGLGQTCSIHIAYRDVIKLTHDAGAELVVKVISPVRNLRMNRQNAPFFIGPLCDGKSLFSSPVNALRLNLLVRGQGGEVFQAQVNAHAFEGLTNASGNGIDLNDDIKEPVAPAVAGKVRAVLDFPVWQGAAVENAEVITLALEFPALERHPSERLLTPVAQVRSLFLATRLGVLLAYGVDRARVQLEFFAGACSEVVQIEPTDPLAAKAQRVFLLVITEVLDEIAGSTLGIKQASQVLDTASVDKQHTVNINSTLRESQQSERLACALYLPGLKAEVSREF